MDYKCLEGKALAALNHRGNINLKDIQCKLFNLCLINMNLLGRELIGNLSLK